MTKWLITGSRSQMTKSLVFNALNKLVDPEKDIIIHGGAYGVDSYADDWCRSKNVKCKIVRPLRKDTGAYYLHRNVEMITMADKVIGFWNGASRGTKFTLDYAKARDKPVILIKDEENING